jgi:hypothetical protein
MPAIQPLQVHTTGVYGRIGLLICRRFGNQPELYDV